MFEEYPIIDSMTGARGNDRHMSENTVNAGLRRLG